MKTRISEYRTRQTRSLNPFTVNRLAARSTFRLAAVALAVSLLLAFSNAIAMVDFTAITNGPHVNDGTMSFGVSWIDYDNDGYLDLYVVNGSLWNVVPRRNQLFHNEGDGTFTEILTGDVVNDLGLSWVAACADVDNDGFIDIAVSNGLQEENQIYFNNGDGTFTKVTEGPTTALSSSNSVTWADFDNDGYLDLFSANDGAGGSSEDSRNTLFRYTGSGFEQVISGYIVLETVTSHGNNWADYDGDGDRDLFVTNYIYVDNGLWRNNGNGTFTKVYKGHMTNDNGYSLGASWGDYDNDGDLDLHVSNGRLPNNNFQYRNEGDGSFTRITDGPIATALLASIGSCWADFDNDGDLDLYVGNAELPEGGPDGPNSMYENLGDGSFVEVTTGPQVTNMGLTCGVAAGDYDRDGDLDLYIARFSGESQNNALYRNEGNDNHWIEIECVGVVSNRSALGAKVRVKAQIGRSDVWQLREICSQNGYGSQSSIEAHFGLGDATTIDSVIIEWPSGTVDRMTGITVDQYLVVTEGEFSWVCGDCNSSGGVDIDDVVHLIAYIFSGGPEPVPYESGDADCSGGVDIDDVVWLISYIFSGGNAPCDTDGDGVRDC
jgi:hypothetical protein